MKVKYLHTNIICEDWQKIADFYQNVFGCTSIYTQRKTSKEWLEQCTNIPNACLEGGMLLQLPGYEEQEPILEIFQYSESEEKPEVKANRKGFGHIAFEVENISAMQDKIIEFGGSNLGQIADVPLGKGKILKIVYMKDPEGNIIELQELP